MARNYIIQKQDTLQKIAKKFYSDPLLFEKLAQYNGILNPDLIRAGQTIEVPSRQELDGSAPAASQPSGLIAPNGLDQIKATFGDILSYIKDDGTLDPRWETDQLASAALPFGMPLSWDPAKIVSNIQCHKKLVALFPEVFAEVQRQGLKNQIRTYGGCFNFRSKRTSGKLSTHSWGIAIDLNPDTNRQGKPGDMDPGIVDVFRQFGFTWGGDWPGPTKDPMHFQFCSGY